MDRQQQLELAKKILNENGGLPTQQSSLAERWNAQNAQPVEQPKNTLQKVSDVAKSVIGGIASGVGGAALTAEDYLGRKIVNAVGTDQMKQNLANSPKLQDQLKQQFGGNENPTAFGVGQLGGEIASLAAPVGAVGKATQSTAKALGASQTASKIAQAGAEGLAFTAGQSVTEGEKQSLKDYAINAGLNMVLPVAGAAAKKVGENAPARIINSLIKPLQKDFAYGKNPGKTVAELGITANNFDDLISNIKTAKSSVGESIGTVIQKASPQLQSQMDLNTYLSPIDEAIAIANKSPRTNATVLSRLEAVKADLVDNINRGIDPQSFKGLVGDLTRWTGNASDDAIVNKSLKQVYGKTSGAMDTVLKGTLTPEEFNAYKKTSEQYGNLISAENAATYRDNIVKRADLISFGAKNSALIAALGTAVASGGGGLTTILAGLGGAAVDKAMATPAFKTRLASLLSKLAPKEVQTFFDKVPTAKALYKQEQLDNLINQAKKNLKNPSNAQGGFINLGGKSDDLINKAKKYKSAEEFVNKQQPITHYTSQKFDKFDLSKTEAGSVWFTDNPKIDLKTGQGLGSAQVGTGGAKYKMDRYINPQSKIIDIEKSDLTDKYTTGQLIDMGYSGVKVPQLDGSNWYEIWEPNKDLLTKSQLTDIWNKANQATAEQSLIQEAKKYKSAEVRDKTGIKLQDPYTAKPLPLNEDGTITLYHSTTKQGAEKIMKDGIIGSKVEGGEIYFTTNKKGYGGIGKDKNVVLEFHIDPKKLKFDDIYRGEIHLKGNNADIGGLKPKK